MHRVRPTPVDEREPPAFNTVARASSAAPRIASATEHYPAPGSLGYFNELLHSIFAEPEEITRRRKVSGNLWMTNPSQSAATMFVIEFGNGCLPSRIEPDEPPRWLMALLERRT